MTRVISHHRGVAQLASAPRLGRGGRRFESSHPDHIIGEVISFVLKPSLHFLHLSYQQDPEAYFCRQI